MCQAAGEDEVAFAGSSSDRGGAGVALQSGEWVELGDVVADLCGDPSRGPVCQGGQARADVPAREGFPGSGVLDGEVLALIESDRRWPAGDHRRPDTLLSSLTGGLGLRGGLSLGQPCPVKMAGFAPISRVHCT